MLLYLVVYLLFRHWFLTPHLVNHFSHLFLFFFFISQLSPFAHPTGIAPFFLFIVIGVAARNIFRLKTVTRLAKHIY